MGYKSLNTNRKQKTYLFYTELKNIPCVMAIKRKNTKWLKKYIPNCYWVLSRAKDSHNILKYADLTNVTTATFGHGGVCLHS